MNRARDTILARVRLAERTALLPRAPAEMPRHLEFASQPAEPCLERFQREARALGIETFLEASAAGVRNRIKTLVINRRVFSWDPELLPYDLGSILDNVVLSRDTRQEQALAEIGVTGCDGAIAETGTLAMLSGRGKSRAAALLPPVHVAVAQRSDLCLSMSEFFRKKSGKLRAAASCSFITGPSRTADIELTLTVGVHGPGRVIVVIGP
ncbi:MAG TPA: lactate utilization protein [Candidatus Dormibacteraeota bacterium]|nr:lactate utilization protein [Candidatus Dormibacteraeota bacterium]